VVKTSNHGDVLNGSIDGGFVILGGSGVRGGDLRNVREEIGGSGVRSRGRRSRSRRVRAWS
jgi:hypothetical protein